jgi:putative ATPase
VAVGQGPAARRAAQALRSLAPVARAPDLFAAAVEDRLARRAPLAARLRPQALDEVAGQRHLLGRGKPLRVLIESDRLSSLILWGPPGTGKTTIARLVAGATSKSFETLSAVSAGVKDVREVAERARMRLGERGQGTILFLDEVHRFTRAQQDVLLPFVEEGLLVFVGATTENPFFSLTGPLLSRSTLFRLELLSAGDLAALVRRALADPERGLGAEPVSIDDDALEHLVDRSEGDARHVLTVLEVAHALVVEDGRDRITLADAEAALALRSVRYGDDEHYDVISAFIKSIRGSDPDAGIYWLARMIEAGEDPRFIARRLVILASEDVGLADSQALLVADAAARAVEYVGLPEAQLNLAHAVLYLALAPKSNSAAAAIGAATEHVRTRRAGPVPIHLRDAHYRGAQVLGHGRGYVYPHDAPSGWVPQEHLPVEAAGERFYRPGRHGAEPEAYAGLERRRSATPTPEETGDEARGDAGHGDHADTAPDRGAGRPRGEVTDAGE